jgi:hypothetical protein
MNNDVAVYLSDSLGNLTLVNREGSQAPDTPDGTVFRMIALDQAVVLTDAGQIAMINNLAGPGVDSTNDLGIWATDRSGVQQLIVRTGDELEVAPGDVRTISDLSFMGANSNTNGWMSGFNNVGQLAFLASFTDGSQGVFVSNKVATVPGDFNFDGTVDAGDYVVWRNGRGTFYTDSHYDIWRANFGTFLTAGSGSVLPSSEPLSAGVPEPASIAFLATVAAVLSLSRSRHRRRFRDR